MSRVVMPMCLEQVAYVPLHIPPSHHSLLCTVCDQLFILAYLALICSYCYLRVIYHSVCSSEATLCSRRGSQCLCLQICVVWNTRDCTECCNCLATPHSPSPICLLCLYASKHNAAEAGDVSDIDTQVPRSGKPW